MVSFPFGAACAAASVTAITSGALITHDLRFVERTVLSEDP
jgi:hypothetical protein